jgi:hypothetical protein
MSVDPSPGSSSFFSSNGFIEMNQGTRIPISNAAVVEIVGARNKGQPFPGKFFTS